jgi:putative drug exporter of the RND superfamily
VSGYSRRPGRVVRVARWSAEHRWRAVLGWVAFVVLCVAVGGAVGTRSQSDADAAVGEWGRSERIVEDGRFADPAVENILVTSRTGALDRDRAAAAAATPGGAWTRCRRSGRSPGRWSRRPATRSSSGPR